MFREARKLKAELFYKLSVALQHEDMEKFSR